MSESDTTSQRPEPQQDKDEREPVANTTSTDPLRLAADLLVFAPIGFALQARELVPKLIADGRRRSENARVIGSFALPLLERQVRRAARERFGVTLPGDKTSKPASRSTIAPATGAPASNATPAKAAPSRYQEPLRDSSTEESSSIPSSTPDPIDGSASALGIDDYDRLPSSVIVGMLARLTPSQRQAVHAHESSHRRRATILHRLSQLET